MGEEKVLQIVLKAKDEASAQIQNVGDKAGGLAKILSGSFKNAAIVSGAALAGLTVAATTSIKAFMESEAVMAQTEAVIKSTGGAAGMSADSISILAGEMMNLTGISDETIQNGENLLLTFTNIGKDVFPMATETMLNMSTALGQDVKNSAIQLGKALNDPINGATALRRVGVSLTEQQLEQIKTFQESGELMKAQKVVLDELQREFGGAAKAAGDTFGGQLNILKEQVGNLQEVFGSFLVKGLKPIIENFTIFVGNISPFLSGTESVDTMINRMREDFGLFGQVFGQVVGFFATHQEALIALGGVIGGILLISIVAATTAMAGFIGLSAPVLLIAGAIGAVGALIIANWSQIKPVLDPIIQAVIEFFGGLATGITSFVNENMPVFQSAWTVIVNLIDYGLKFISGLWNTVWPSIKQVFDGIWKQIKGILEIAWGAIQVIIGVGLGILSGDWSKAWSTMKGGFLDIWEGLKTYVSGWWEAVKGVFKGGINSILGMLNGFINVINKAGGAVGVNIPNIPSFDTGGWVKDTGLAMVHKGEFVLSNDMIAGKTTTPITTNNNNSNQSITIGPVVVQDISDIDLLGQRLAFQLATSGSL